MLFSILKTLVITFNVLLMVTLAVSGNYEFSLLHVIETIP